jgi:hypothetical protein
LSDFKKHTAKLTGLRRDKCKQSRRLQRESQNLKLRFIRPVEFKLPYLTFQRIMWPRGIDGNGDALVRGSEVRVNRQSHQQDQDCQLHRGKE